jgi:hypothetical protein
MSSLKSKPRSQRPNYLFFNRKQGRKAVLAVEQDKLSRVECLKTEPLEFFRQVLGVEPTDYQKEFIELFLKNQFVAARWCRSRGKASRRRRCCLIMLWLILQYALG